VGALPAHRPGQRTGRGSPPPSYLQEAGRSAATARSYGVDMLRWFRSSGLSPLVTLITTRGATVARSASTSGFSRAFREAYGITPTEHPAFSLAAPRHAEHRNPARHAHHRALLRPTFSAGDSATA
jgi:hypothetical protein